MKIVVGPAGLGDEISMTPVVRELRRRRPRERILLTNLRFPELWDHNPYLSGGDEDSGATVKMSHGEHWDAGSIPRKFGRQLGVELLDDVPEIFLTAEEKAHDFGVGDWGGTVAIDVWGSCAARRWPADRFAELARRLSADGWRVLEVGRHDGPALPCWRSFRNRLTVRQTAALIRRCTLYVGNDSGLFHVAAAVGTLHVGVFGPSVLSRRLYWHSVGVRGQRPCGRLCDLPNKCAEIPDASRCLSEVAVDDVREAVALALRRHDLSAPRRPGS